MRKQGIYATYIKRSLDIVCAILALTVFWWLYLIVAILIGIKLGSPILFEQKRPGKDGKIFTLYKFRSMTDEIDSSGNLMPDGARLTKFGKWLRNTSLDELPEVFNILKGDMSVIGPRPQLVRDMVFMTEEQRRRHLIRPGLSGLAQVNGRNSISWEKKINYDLQYLKKITFCGDLKIIIQTVRKAFIKQEGVTENDMPTSENLGDYLLRTGQIEKDKYKLLQIKAKKMLKEVP